MTIQKSILAWLYEQAGTQVSYTLVAQSSNTNIVIPPSGTSFWPMKPHGGFIRIKQNVLNSNCNVKLGPIVATDGTNIANLYPGDANASGNNQYIDASFFFWYDWQAANISLNAVCNNNTATFDVEVVGWA